MLFALLMGAVALLTVWAGGALAFANARLDEESAPGRVVCQFALGVCILTVLQSTLHLAGSEVRLAPYYVLLGALVIWRVLIRGSSAVRLEPSFRFRVPANPAARAFLAATVALLLVLAAAALRDRLVWDAWAFWTFKANVLLREGRIPEIFMSPASPYHWLHPEYPLALPLVDWWIFRHAGGFDPALASVAGVIWHAGLPLLIWQALRREVGEPWAAAAAFGVTAFWPIALTSVGGYAEVLMTLAMLGAVVELASGELPTSRSAIARYVVYLTLGALAKNEGLVLAVLGIAVGAGVLIRARMRNPGKYLALCIPLIALAPWYLFVRGLGLEPEQLGGLADLPRIRQHGPILLRSLVELVTTRAWIPVPFILLAGLLARRARSGTDARAGWVLVLSYFLATHFVLLLTPLDLAWVLINTHFRMIGVLLPSAVYLCVREMGLLERAGRSRHARAHVPTPA